MAHNPLPDGFQNEYLHEGNAYDLWGAVTAGDLWHARWYMYTGYWPWGFYAVPWPAMALFGPTRGALLAGNLLHLAVLLWGARELGRALDAPLSPLLLILTPAVFGSLVRYEPNLANIAWVTAGLACLVRSQGLRQWGWTLGYGLCLGLGMMMDRLSAGFFLIPAVLPLLWRADRRAWRNLGMATLLALLLCSAWYREFFLRNSDELFSQAPVGEIDSAGDLTEAGAGPRPLWYLLTLLDSQAGPFIGLLMLGGLAGALRLLLPSADRRLPDGRWQQRAVLMAAVVVPTLFFTLIAKKQLYYTLPVVGPLAVLAARPPRLVWLGIAAGLWAFLGRGVGLVPGGPWMPEAWVAPRHTLARPPSRQTWPLEEATAALGPDPGGIVVLSEDETLFEGFVVLAAREAWPQEDVRGAVVDPVGTYEFLPQTGSLLTVGPRGVRWPTARAVEAQLLADHYRLEALPPVARSLAQAATDFEEIGRWPGGDIDVVAWRRRASPETEPPD